MEPVGKPVSSTEPALRCTALNMLHGSALTCAALQSFSLHHILMHYIHCIVSALRLEEGYTVKYSLSPRDFPRVQAIFHHIAERADMGGIAGGGVAPPISSYCYLYSV